MRKSILTLAAIITTFTTTIVAQDSDNNIREKLTFGVKAGLNRSNVYDAKGQDFKADAKFGFAGGVFVGIPLSKYLGLQPEVLISQKGYQSTGTLFGTGYADSRTTTHLDIPLQLQLKPVEYLTFLAGVQYSYLLHQKDVFTFGNNSVEQDQEFKNDNARKNIFGAVVGIDVNIDHFVFSAKACWDLQTNAGNGSSFTPRYKNVWLQGTIAFRLY